MASHRKPRPGIRAGLLTTAGPRAAVGLTAAALATVTLLGETASAAPMQPQPPSIEEVQAKVDALNHDAEVATERYNGAKEQADLQSSKVESLLNQVAQRTASLNDARRVLGQYAAAQYRSGGVDATSTFLLSDTPQEFFDQTHQMKRMTSNQKEAVENFRVQQATTTTKRSEAVKGLDALNASRTKLETEKQTVKEKLTAAQQLLNTLTEQEKARLAAAAAKKAEDDRKRAAAIAAKEKATREAAAKEKAKTGAGSGTGTGTGTGTGGSGSSTSSSAAEKAIAFARKQLGKPYVWGATGPNSFDCSGLTQAAWDAAGVTLPRTTWDQVKTGDRVAMSDLRPGDLIFFYDDISHVGLYIGDGNMIHAPHTGTVVKIAPITQMPFYGASRPS
ncbi:C40 family peptidase [Streptomyces sp. SPB162]|uniref:C40 family peptidase n=1 Tax=Streptomyces sp. SPB162 TaxID=2940560 RepID=UPI00240702C7|nr:C40 family peptidase [Streptomyces sp. SPB162]MDF9815123.1 cell wall-associated NlpC family hydrolase [Streptomyces sp. SPB162]